MSLISFMEINPSWALRSDRDQPIDIRADRVEISEKEEISQYIGNVNLKQGTLNIQADKITVYLNNGKLNRIVIQGDPATFQQQPEDNKDVVTSKALHMEYFANKQHLVLKDNAQVIQGANRFQGDLSLIHISEPTRQLMSSRMPSSA